MPRGGKEEGERPHRQTSLPWRSKQRRKRFRKNERPGNQGNVLSFKEDSPTLWETMYSFKVMRVTTTTKRSRHSFPRAIFYQSSEVVLRRFCDRFLALKAGFLKATVPSVAVASFFPSSCASTGTSPWMSTPL